MRFLGLLGLCLLSSGYADRAKQIKNVVFKVENPTDALIRQLQEENKVRRARGGEREEASARRRARGG